jgi:cytochrome c oxidase subunit 3
MKLIQSNNHHYDTPRSRSARAIGMWLFLASLSMLFIAGMMLYVLLRAHVFGRAAPGAVHLPEALWASTAILLAASATIHRALVNVRRERIKRFRIYLYITFALAIAFLCIQFPSLLKILALHRAQSPNGLRMYGLVFCLISLHAAHVIGGIVALTIVTIRAAHNQYDHENYYGVRYAAVYWHFLDIIWIIMFGTFLLTG